jgi:two-component system, cell cycle response regulator
MVYLLSAFGHQTLEAHDGAEGIEVAQREKPELILLDIHMPRMDGYEVASHLQRSPVCIRIPLVAVTALAMVGDREKILASGFTGYIAKPIDPETFPSQVQGFLGAPPSQKAPVPRSAAAHESASQATSVVKNKLAIVLFVDNTQTNIDLVRSTLEPSGYEVVAALSVREGMDLAHRIRPDLILSDVHMPNQDGYEFMRLVQANPELSKIPFVFLSSSVWSTREKEQALLQGAKKFISRPIEPDVLLSEVKQCLRNTPEH